MTTKYLAVPIGTATSAEWRGVIARHGVVGYQIFWCASALAEMAAKAAAGGAIVYPSKEPKSPQEICAELGVTESWGAEYLFPCLLRLGEGYVEPSTGSWVCTSPMLSRTLCWQEETNKLLLPASSKKPGRPRKVDAKTSTQRSAECRARKAAENSRKCNENASENSHNICCTDSEYAEITQEKLCSENPLKEFKENLKTSSSYSGDDDEIGISKVLVDVPTSQRRKVGEAVKAALQAGHQLHAAHQAIDEARHQASLGRPWVGLALYKLSELAASTPPPPTKQTTKPVESPSDQQLFTDPERELAFQQIMSNPQGEAYQSLFAKISDFAREMGPECKAFSLSMREVFDSFYVYGSGQVFSAVVPQ